MMIGQDPLEWQEVNTEHIVRDEWIDFYKCQAEFNIGGADIFLDHSSINVL